MSADLTTTGDVLLRAEYVALSYTIFERIFKRRKHEVFHDVSFSLDRGETLAVVGRNGAGKSTLLRLLAGILSPTKGRVWRKPGITTSILALGVGFNPYLTGRDNVIMSALIMGRDREWAEAHLEAIKAFSELGDAFEQSVRTYSAGMRSRLGFSTALFMEVDVLLVDEVLAVGDGHFRKKARDALVNKLTGEQTVVLVSHSTSDARQLATQAIWLEEGVVVARDEASPVLDAYERSL